MTTAVVELPAVDIDRREMLRYLGHRGQRVDAELAARIDEAVERALQLARPRAAWRRFAVAERVTRPDGLPKLRLSGSALVLAGRSVASLLAQASAVAVMAVTLGMGVERELRSLSLRGDALSQALFDAAATALVEGAADAAEALVVADAARRGEGVTRRFSPGYGDLPLDCQPALVASVDATRRLGLTLTASDLMVPTKSVTAVMGIGEQVVHARGSACESCAARDRCAVRDASLAHASCPGAAALPVHET